MGFFSRVSNYVDVLWWLIYPPAEEESAASESTAEKPEQPIPVQDNPSSPLFALIIGINKYNSDEVTTLKGAVADADSIQTYLKDHLNVSESRIRNLRDEQATRAAIISEFTALASNDVIKHGDPILIYYAGHGGEAPPPIGWGAGGADSKTQMLIPHDYRTKIDDREVHGVPDRTIGALVNRLAKSKGDNITIIFDCCHSGSGARDQEKVSNQNVRGFEITTPIPAELDKKVWGNPGDRATKIPPGFLQSGLRSHVLLAACGAKEKAKEEQGRGVFTKAFLDILASISADTVTYADLLQRIHALPEQNPQCEGVNQGRILFNAKAPSTGRVLYKVHKDGAKYVLDAGAAHGINKGAVFSVYQDRDFSQKASPLGTLVVKETGPFTTTMELPDDASIFPLTETGYALQTKTGEEEDLRLYIELNEKLTPIFKALGEEMLRPDSNRRRISLVDKDKAELAISLDGDRVVFNILNPQVTQYGLNQMPFRIPATYDDVFPVIRASAHYHWHLRRNNTSRVLQKHIDVSFKKLVELDGYDDDFNPIIEPVGDNLNVNGVIDLVVNSDDMYGIEITNKSALDLYPSVFYFDNSDLSISSYYQPPTSAQKLDVPLPAKSLNGPGSLTIGYGSGGAAPFSYFMREGQNVDVGFLKLFLTTQPVDYSNIPQPSPFKPDDRDTFIHQPKPRLIWDTILIAVVQRRAPST